MRAAGKVTIDTADHSTVEAAKHDADARIAAYVETFGPIAVFVHDENGTEIYCGVQG
jgi:hypothetical protein